VLGIYYLSFFAANKIVGAVGGWYSSMNIVSFWLLHVASAAIGLGAFLGFKLILGPKLLRERVSGGHAERH
jgi:POT family proton-dependent oligopeptide transporter